MKKIILASGSPRRREILKRAGLEFEVHPSGYEEVLENDIYTSQKIEKLAYNKALYVADELKEDALVIGADTVVVLNNKILTKPTDRANAIEMLRSLSGVEHHVVTGVCVIDILSRKTLITHTVTTVEFEDLTDEKIEYYVDNYKPFDKAGAYGIQELPDGYIKTVDGSLENVIGLCSKTVLEMISQF